MPLTYVFALALSVVGVVALSLTTYAVLKRLDALAPQVSSLNSAVAVLQEGMKQTAPAALRIELDALAGGVEALRASNRRELGKLWSRITQRPLDIEPREPRPIVDDDHIEDGDVAAMLALQRAPNGAPR